MRHGSAAALPAGALSGAPEVLWHLEELRVGPERVQAMRATISALV